VTAAGAALYLVVDPHTADLAAQEYRVGLFERAGFTVWDNGWYAGHHTPAYSVLFPPLGAVLGAQLAGALAAVVATLLFTRLAEAHWGPRARAGALWFAVAMAVVLLTGRMTFILGTAIGLGAMLALRGGRPALAAALAAACTLASPVSGLFAALAAVAWGLADPPARRGWAAAIAAAALGPAFALSALFPEGGDEPFVPSAFWPALAGIGLVALGLPARERALRIGAGLYAAGTVLAFALTTPLGGNVTRLGALLAGPVLLGALLGQRRPALLGALLLPLAYWGLYPPVRDVVRVHGDPSVHAGYYAGLVRFLESRPPGFRVEVPFTENHWEAALLAEHVPLARGWERQLDRKYGALFYDDELDPARYRRWIDEHAVRYVALPDVDLDYAAEPEGRLLRRGVPWLRPVWRDAHWQVFEVRRARGLLAGVPGSVRLTDRGFVLRAARAGVATVRVRHSRWFDADDDGAHVRESADGFTQVVVPRPGTVRVEARPLG
jgi:hypothetical protein